MRCVSGQMIRGPLEQRVRSAARWADDECRCVARDGDGKTVCSLRMQAGEL